MGRVWLIYSVGQNTETSERASLIRFWDIKPNAHALIVKYSHNYQHDFRNVQSWLMFTSRSFHPISQQLIYEEIKHQKGD